MENDFNFFNQYLDQQKKFMDQWGQMMKNLGNNFGVPFNLQNPMEAYNSMLKGFTDSPVFSYTGSPGDMLGKLNQGSEVYYNLYKLYKDIYEKNVEPTEENIKKTIEDFKSQSVEYMNNYVYPYLPLEVQDIMKKAYGVSETFQSGMQTVYGPWVDSVKQLTDSFAKGALKDPEGFLEYFNEWKENYEKTFGKLLNMPMMGINRNEYQEKMQTLDKYIKFLTYATELTIKLSTIVNDTTENVIKDSFDLLKNGEQPKTFEEFYNFWKTNLSNNFDKLFYSDEFSKFLGNFVDSVMVLKIQMDKVIEDSLKYFPIPTNRDLDSLYKTVHDLKKEVRMLKKELKKIDKEESNKENK